MTTPDAMDQAADALRHAEALLIGAGAGMGVDSGLPDFRGPEGFWKAYPPFRGRRLAEISNPYWFRADPELAWGFFGHRLGLYRHTAPHDGFARLLEWGRTLPGGAFVFTSNVDGQFQKAGFPEDVVLECHGSIHHLQCARPCGDAIWPADDVAVDVDMATVRATSELPRCLRCGGVARPNILMFGDDGWLSTRTDAQERRFDTWLRGVANKRLVVLELGAGLAIPTVRMTCESVGGTLIRVNPRESGAPLGAVSLPLGARDAVAALAERASFPRGGAGS